MAQNPDADWVSRQADDVIAEAARRGTKTIVCASGLSPSGPIHMGNLREIMTPHLVADEIRRRGINCKHIVSWDDYDRFRKVPNGINENWSEHIGKPLTSVPAPEGSRYPNWAEHFKAPMISALENLGIEYEGISQTEKYTSGAYREQILLSMRERKLIDTILGRYRTKKKAQETAPTSDEEWAEQQASEGSGAASDEDGAAAAGYFPYKPYCDACEKDFTTVFSYDDATTELSYRCECGHERTVRLTEYDHGKLVWKVDWPMRWAYEDVIYEPSGVDHSSPGSSFVVGSQIVREVFGTEPPIGPMYAFVGIKGMAKMSSSKGNVPTPSDALEIVEEPLLRWLYARRKPQQSFTIAFDQEIHRVYDEWDSLERKVKEKTISPIDLITHSRATRTTAGELPTTPLPLPYRTLASIVDITTGNPEQTLRIASELDPDHPVTTLDELRPRLDRATRWVETQLPEEERTHIRQSPDEERLRSLDTNETRALELFVNDVDTHWSLEGLTTLVYSVPKIVAGLPLDVKPTPELKAIQRRFFALLYTLLIGKETGPRLPTLLLAIGSDQVRKLLTTST